MEENTTLTPTELDELITKQRSRLRSEEAELARRQAHHGRRAIAAGRQRVWNFRKANRVERIAREVRAQEFMVEGMRRDVTDLVAEREALA